MIRFGWGLVGIALIACVGWASTQVGFGAWPYGQAARGALLAGCGYLVWTIARSTRFVWSRGGWLGTLGGLAGAAWCCVPLNQPTARDALDAGLLALGASLTLGFGVATAVVGLARAWGGTRPA